MRAPLVRFVAIGAPAVLIAACGSSNFEVPTVGDWAAPGTDGGPAFVDAGMLTQPAQADASVGANEALCNGIDDDRNGVVDDVDVGKDGICDCLAIGTIGRPGTAGVGNVFYAWLRSRSSTPVSFLGDGELTDQVLAPLHVIVAEDLQNGRTYSLAEVAALERWIKAGGGLMTLIGYGAPSEIVNINSLLVPHGIQYGNTPILYRGGSTIPVTSWQPHAVTAGVSQLGIDNGYPVLGTGQVLATEGGYDVLRALEIGSGHVLVWGDEWITFDTEWKGHPEYQVELFWLNAFKWLSRVGHCQVAIPASVK